MNKIVTFIIILIGFVQVSFAQIQFKDSTEAYNYWAKRGVIEVVYAYMEDYIIAVGEAKATTEIVGKDKYFEEFLKDIDSEENLPDFAQISTFLKNNSWKECEKTVFQPLKKQVENAIDLESLFSLKREDKNGNEIPIDFIGGETGNNLNKSEQWKEKTTEIYLKYNKSLSVFNKEEPKVIENTSEPFNFKNKVFLLVKKQLKSKLEPNPNQILWNDLLMYASFLIIGILIGGCLILLITKRKIKSIINKGNEGKYDNYLNAQNDSWFLFGYLRVVSFLQKQKDKYKNESESASPNNSNEIGGLEQKVFQLEKEKKELFDKNIELGKEFEQKSIQKIEGEAERHIVKTESFSNQPPKQITKIYFSMPEGDGSFKVIDGEPSNDGRKYFEIAFKELSNIGEIYYLSSQRDNRAINQMEDFLKPVCDIENITNSSTSTKIKLIHSGKVTLINDSWVIDPENKIKIVLL